MSANAFKDSFGTYKYIYNYILIQWGEQVFDPLMILEVFLLTKHQKS